MLRRFASCFRSKAKRELGARTRRLLGVEPLESRLLLASDVFIRDEARLDVVLINQNVVAADTWLTAGQTGVVAMTYDPAWLTNERLVGLLQKAVDDHGGVPIGHLAIVTHGEAGRIALGQGATWTLESVTQDAATLDDLRSVLNSNARIDVFACNVAETVEGRQLVDSLAAITGATINASSNGVGNVDGADFIWEYSTSGTIPDRNVLDVSRLGDVTPFTLLGDYAESNDTFATAAFLGRAGSVDGNGYTIHSATDVDYIRFSMDQAANSSHYVRATFTHSMGDIDIALYSSTNQFLRSSTGVADNEQISLDGLGAGTYYLKIYGFAGAINNYSVQLRGPAYTAPGDFLEANNTRATAIRVPSSGGVVLTGANIHASTDEDWFQFEMFAAGRAGDNVRIDNFVHGNADLDMQLYNAQGTALLSSTSTSNVEQISLTGLPAGLYYARIYPFSFTTLNNYQFNLTTPPLTGNTADFAEPNDSKAAAYNLGSLTADSTFNGLSIHTAGNEDWFRFTTTAAGTTANKVRIEFSHAAGDVDMFLYDSNDQVVGTSTSVGDSEEISLSGRPAGTYYLKVYGYNSALNPSYRLIVMPPSGPVGDALEVNDTRATATDLGSITTTTTRSNLSIHTASDSDWLRFQTTAAGNANSFVRLTFAHSAGDIDVRLTDSAGNILRSSTGVTDSEQISLSGLAAGVYYVQVYGYSGATNPNYSLVVEPPRPTNSLDPLEPNDTLATARDLGTLRGMQAPIPNLSIHSNTDLDFYKFTTTGAGAAGHFVQIDFQHRSGDIDMQLLNSSGTQVGISNGTSDREMISLAGMAAGTYYIRVFGYNGALNPSYSLTISAPTGGTTISADRLEPNNTQATATLVRNSTTATTLVVGTSLQDLSIHVANDQDFFTFTTVATAGANDGVRIQFINANGDLTLTLMNSSGAVIRTSATTNDIEMVSLNGLAAGTYVVLVNGAPNTYSITFATPASPTTPTTPTGDDWTILVYMTASNLQSAAFDDINEMEVAASRLPGSVNIVAFWDQSSQRTMYQTGNGSQAAWGTVGRAVIAPDTNMTRVATTFEVMPEQNTGDPNTLRSFIQWATAAAPAQRYALIMWDHGSGLQGSNYDDSDGATFDYLSLPEFSSTLATSGLPRMNVVGYDACLMGVTEIGYSLRNVTDVFVSSQELVSGPGYDYRTAFSALQTNPQNVNAEGFATSLVQSFQQQYGGRTNNDTLSAIRTSQYNALAAAIGGFVATTTNATAAELSTLRAARGSAIAYDSQSSDERDLGSYMRTVANSTSLSMTIRNAATSVVSVLAAAVVTKTTDQRSSSGASIYLPSGAPTSVYNGYTGFTGTTQWDAFLRRIAGARTNLPGDPNSRSATAPDFAEDNNSVATAFDLGTVSGPGVSQTGLNLHTSSDVDWYRFATSAVGGPSHNITVIPGNATEDQILVTLFDASGASVLQQSVGGIGAQVVSLQGVAAGAYTVRVTTPTGAVVSNYTLIANAPVGDPSNDMAGDNSTQAKAYPLGGIADNRTIAGLGIGASANDWFTFEGPRLSGRAPFTLRVQAPGGAPLSAAIYDAASNLLVSGSGNGLVSLNFVTQGATEGYFLRVTGGGQATNYSLNFVATREAGVVLNGTNLFVTGTSDDDTISLSFATSGLVELIANGVTTSYSASSIGGVVIDGGLGSDTLVISGRAAAETWISSPGQVQLLGAGYSVNALSVENATILAGPGDISYVSDSPGTDTFIGQPAASTLMTDSTTSTIAGSPIVYASSSGGNDIASFVGTSAGGDIFYGLPSTGILISGGTIVQSLSFANNVAQSGGGHDYAILVDSAADDTLVAAPNNATLQGGGVTNQALGFTELYVFGTFGNDTAILHDAATNDFFYGLSIYSIMHGPVVGGIAAFLLEAVSFDTVRGVSSGGTDYASYYDSSGNDQFNIRSDSTEIIGSNFSVRSEDFAGVYMYALGGGNDSVDILDGPGNDYFLGDGSLAFMSYEGGNFVNAQYFLDNVTVRGVNGGVNGRTVRAVDYTLSFQGNWIDI